jgi:peptidyl-prolyl cis-trans isomerase SurA
MRKTVLITIILILINIPNAMAGILLDRVVVIIDRDVITWSELYKTMEFELRREIAGLDNKERTRILNEYSNLFLERMIDMKIQTVYAKKHGMSVPQREIDGTIEDISSKNSMTTDEFKNRVTAEGFDWEDYKEMLSKQLLISRVVRSEVRNKLVVSDEKITEYINNNPVNSNSQSIRIRQIFLTSKNDESKKLAEDLYKQIKDGGDFSKLASQYSQGPNAKGGGDLGYVELEDLNDQFKGQISNLMIGQTSMPFESPEGISIIQLVDKKQALSGNMLRDMIREKLNAELFEKAYKDWVKSLKEKTYMEILL